MRPGIGRNTSCTLDDCLTLGLRAVHGLGSCGSQPIHALPVTPAQLMRPGTGWDASCTLDGVCHQGLRAIHGLHVFTLAGVYSPDHCCNIRRVCALHVTPFKGHCICYSPLPHAL